jgi:hypothetical protein
VTFDTWARYDICDLISARLGMFLENVVENGASIRQDIYRYGARATTDLRFTRFWTATANYTFGHYSDRNDYNELYVRTDYRLTLPPKELKVVLSTDLLGYRETTQIGTLPVVDLGDVPFLVHPYFAPKFYAYYEARLEWKQWLSRDYFTYANQCWYALYGGTGWDNNFNNYYTLRALLNYDVRSWLTLGVDAQQILSPVYNATAVTAYLVVRWPCWFR